MMQSRNEAQRRQDEPKVIAISATRPRITNVHLWAIGAALLTYGWFCLVLH